MGPHSTKVAVRKLELKIEYVSTEKMGLLHFSHSAVSVRCAVAVQCRCAAADREVVRGGVCTARKRGIVRRALAECTCKAIPMTKGIDEMQPTHRD